MQSDDLRLVPVAWRHRGPRGGWITTETKQAWSEQPLYDAAAIERLVAENAQMQELMLLADRFCMGKDGRGRSVWVASRGPSSWAVWDGAFVLATDGEWEAEPMPSSRDEAFIARTRHTFAEAVRRARQALKDAP